MHTVAGFSVVSAKIQIRFWAQLYLRKIYRFPRLSGKPQKKKMIRTNTKIGTTIFSKINRRKRVADIIM